MYYIFDQDGYKGDFGSTETIAAIEEIGLVELNKFLAAGFTLNPEKVVGEIEGVGYVFSELNDILMDTAEVLDECVGLAILSSSVS